MQVAYLQLDPVFPHDASSLPQRTLGSFMRSLGAVNAIEIAAGDAAGWTENGVLINMATETGERQSQHRSDLTAIPM